ncbi:MAG: response regulator [Gammaproteobacteria bacterium]|nr:response regulator [Gammaproteobacteria bacterium]
MYQAIERFTDIEAPSEARQSPARQCLKVLYVEDDISSQYLVVQACKRRKQWDLQIASTLEQGLEQLTDVPDVILLGMDRLDGSDYELFDHIRETESLRGIPVIAVTAKDLRAKLEEGSGAGFSAFVTKPFNLNTLLVNIETCTGL